MSIRADIPKSANWYRYETKTITITVLTAAGAPVNLTSIDLSWRIMRAQGSSTIYLTRVTPTGISISGAGSNIAVINITVSDYTALPAGIHYHELWDSENDYLLAHGDAYIHASRGAPTA
jgi:hypothetical protein